MAFGHRRTIVTGLRLIVVGGIGVLVLGGPSPAGGVEPPKAHMHKMGPRVLDENGKICFVTHDEAEPYAGIERLEFYSTLGSGPPPPRPPPAGVTLHRFFTAPLCQGASTTPPNGEPCGAPAEGAECAAAGGTCPPLRNRVFEPDCCSDCLRPGKQFICGVVYQKGHEVSDCAFFEGGAGIGRVTPDEDFPVLVNENTAIHADFCGRSYEDWKFCCPVVNVSSADEPQKINYRRPCPPAELCDPPPQPGTPHLIIGTRFADTILDDDTAGCIYGMDGDDVVKGFGGDDEIHAGAGNDVVKGGDGDDLIYGDGGADKLFGNAGSDTLCGGDGPDTLNGGGAGDVVDGGAGEDRCKRIGSLDTCSSCLGSASCNQQAPAICSTIACGQTQPPACGGDCANANATCVDVGGTCACTSQP